MHLHVEHITIYRYAEPVKLQPHRLLLRPREGHDQKIISSQLVITPKPRLRWVHDVFENSVTIADFEEMTGELRIESNVVLEHFNYNPLEFLVDPWALELPLVYAQENALVLAPYLPPQFPEEQDIVRDWLRPFMKLDGHAQTLDFLIAVNRAMPLFFSYARREEAGVQSPAETLRKRTGSCRDFALLLMESARSVGLAARFVSGYLCSACNEIEAIASQATHAWAEIFLPGAGWKGFDPTSGLLAAQYHMRVAVAREPQQALPISGNFMGRPGASLSMEVHVTANHTA